MSGAALIAGSAGMIMTMAFHPTGHELVQPGQEAAMAHAAIATHALALASLPVFFLGACGLARRVAGAGRLGFAGLVVYGFALVAVLSAAVLSGLVGPAIAHALLAAEPGERALWNVVGEFDHFMNQGFAQVYVVASSVAIVLWSAAILKSAALARGLGLYGCVLGPLAVLALVSGHVRLDVHGFGLIVLGQALWFVGAGVLLWRAQRA